MISKEKFVEIINRLKNYNDLQKQIDDLFDNQIDNKELDFMNAGSICISHETVVVDLLESIFETDMISWWIYETDYGKSFKIGAIVALDDDYKPDLTTVENLYDYVLREYNFNHVNNKVDFDENKSAILQKAYEEEKGKNLKLRLQTIPLLEGNLQSYKDRVIEIKKEIEIKNKMIDLMAKDLKTSVNSAEWVKKYYEERAREGL